MISSDVGRADGPLLQTARRRFGSFKAAVEKARFDYSEYRKVHRRYTRKDVIDEFRKMHRDGFPIYYHAMQRERQALIHAALTRFSTYRAALEAAGLEPERIRKDPWASSGKWVHWLGDGGIFSLWWTQRPSNSRPSSAEG